MRFLSLFSGIGGFDLGLERAGMTCVGQVEIDPYCRAVLAKHWPNVPRLEDVRTVRGDEFGPVDLIAGGVPCQPASCAGKRKGEADERWLWGEWSRLVRAIGPAWFIAENVRGFLSLPAAGGVVRDLEGAGYEVRTVLLGAHHVGAPHRRDRIWIVGHAGGDVAERRRRLGDIQGAASKAQSAAHERERLRHAAGDSRVADAHRNGFAPNAGTAGQQVLDPRSRSTEEAFGLGATRWPSRPGESQAEWEAPRLVQSGHGRREDRGLSTGPGDEGERAAGAAGPGQNGLPDPDREPANRLTEPRRECGVGLAESRVGVATHGFPRRLAGFARRSALKALGNAVVPDVAEVIGRAIMEAAA